MTAPYIALDLAVYSCSTDAVLFVPDLCSPPRDAELAFGPFAWIGTVHVPEPTGGWRTVLSQIERHLFATVSRSEARLLVGLQDHPALAADAPRA